MKLEVRKIGNSTGVIRPKERITRLNLQQGQWLHQAQATVAILGLAAGEIDESGLTRWIRDNWPKP